MILYDENNLSHKHLNENPINAPQVKPDVIHLYFNKTMQEGPDIINHWKSQTSAQSEIKLAAASIYRILKEKRETCPGIRYLMLKP